jgi:hypothetical protein
VKVGDGVGRVGEAVGLAVGELVENAIVDEIHAQTKGLVVSHVAVPLSNAVDVVDVAEPTPPVTPAVASFHELVETHEVGANPPEDVEPVQKVGEVGESTPAVWSELSRTVGAPAIKLANVGAITVPVGPTTGADDGKL